MRLRFCASSIVSQYRLLERLWLFSEKRDLPLSSLAARVHLC